MKKEPNPRPHPRRTPPAGGLTEWMRTECQMDHGGTEVSYRLKMARDGRSFTVTFRDKHTRTITVNGQVEIQLVFPSVEGTVVRCRMMRGPDRYFNVTDGHELTQEELRRINPHFYV